MLKKLFLILVLALLPTFAQAEVYVLPHAGIRLTADASWTLLTPESLEESAPLLAELGVEADTLAAAYQAEHILAEVYLPEGQVSIAVLQTERSNELRSITRMTEAEKQALADEFAHMALYQDVSWTTPEWLTMHWTLESGGLAVTWMRAVSVRQGALYLYTACSPGESGPDALWPMLEQVIGRTEYLGSIRETSSPAPLPTPMPQPTPAPTPGVAALSLSEGNLPLTVAGLPAYADNTLLTVQGQTEPSARVRVALGEQTLASGQANGRGLFGFDLVLPAEDGLYTLSFQAARGEGHATAEYAVELRQRTVPMEIVTPEGRTVGASFDLTVRTLPGAYIRLTTPNGSLRARAGEGGLVNFTINVRGEGMHGYQLESILDGYRTGLQTLEVERVLSDQERLNNFRRTLG
ncbi:MAG TPA: hypothetical protein PKE04_09900, partial [Clostridia bacterium]|nr:hypothetical protein [Clostridia bacterium]